MDIFYLRYKKMYDFEGAHEKMSHNSTSYLKKNTNS